MKIYEIILTLVDYDCDRPDESLGYFKNRSTAIQHAADTFQTNPQTIEHMSDQYQNNENYAKFSISSKNYFGDDPFYISILEIEVNEE